MFAWVFLCIGPKDNCLISTQPILSTLNPSIDISYRLCIPHYLFRKFLKRWSTWNWSYILFLHWPWTDAHCYRDIHIQDNLNVNIIGTWPTIGSTSGANLDKQLRPKQEWINIYWSCSTIIVYAVVVRLVYFEPILFLSDNLSRPSLSLLCIARWP